mgnify:CR=1 FL=1
MRAENDKSTWSPLDWTEDDKSTWDLIDRIHQMSEEEIESRLRELGKNEKEFKG